MRKANVTNNLTELKENSALGGNVGNNQTELTENSGKELMCQKVTQNSQKTARKALT